jgi:hypothetical protein
VTPSGTEFATFRLVQQCLNQLDQGLLRKNLVSHIISGTPNLKVKLSSAPQEFVHPPSCHYHLTKINIYGSGVAANGLKYIHDLINILQIAEK